MDGACEEITLLEVLPGHIALVIHCKIELKNQQHMSDVPQPSHDENSFKSSLTWPKYYKTGFGHLRGPKWPKIGILGTFLQKFVNTTKFSIRLSPSKP